MKKVKVFLIILICMLFFYTNETYATTKGTYVASESSGIEKFILIGIGIAAVAFVLFIGYKMDKKEESQKRREKFINDNKKDDSEDAYSAVYNTTNYQNESIIEESNINAIEEIYNKRNSVEDENIEDDYEEEYVEEQDEVYEEDEENYEEIVEDTVESYEENIEIQDFEEDTDEEEPINIYEEEIIDEEEIPEYTYEENSFSSSNRNIDDMLNVLGSSDSTMVFNSQALKDEEENALGTVKGYDFDEDDDLSELESIIKDANIKKYVRNKDAEEAMKKQHEKKSTGKKYTRKKEKHESEPKQEQKNNVKRYTRKKVVVEPVEEIEIEVDIEPEKVVKRGRPKKSEVAEKPKRGRPRKTETAEKPKRGRPKKTGTTSKTRKRSTPKTTKTTKK